MIAPTSRQTIDMATLDQLADLIADRVAEKLASRPKQRFVSLKELAGITGLGPRTLARWKSAGKLPFETAGRRVLIPMDAALKAIADLHE
jgi:hypothetical protein